jgi:hypothetical protein
MQVKLKARDSKRAQAKGEAMRILSELALGLLLTACSARVLEVGSDHSPGGDLASGNVSTGVDGGAICSPDLSPPLPTWPPNDDCTTGTQQPQFLGQWDGYIQGTSISDQFSTFLLNITAANETRVCGTLTFGDRAPLVTLPPVTDPNNVYPPATIRAQSRTIQGPFLGVPYTLISGQRNNQRMTFDVALSEVFKEWCSLQSPYGFRNGCSEFQCVPAGYSFSLRGPDALATADCQTQVTENGPMITVPCGRLMLCSAMNPFCVCNASHCVAKVSDSDSFDLTISGDTASGVYGSSTVLFHRLYTTDN